MTFRKKVYDILDADHRDSFIDRLLNYFIAVLILLNVISIIVDSVLWIQKDYGWYLEGFEHFVIFVFTIEYVFRLWSIKENPKYSDKYGRLKYSVSLMALVDLVSIFPYSYFVNFVFNLSFVRILRLLRLIRVFKLERYSKGVRKIVDVFKLKKHELITSFCILLFVTIISSCFIYFAEYEAQPDKFSSIPESMYWSVVTLTTIGYGDVFPITIWGKIFTSILAITGIGFTAIPAAIIISGFLELQPGKVCPHCNKEL